MILHTASEGITFARKLENDSAEFYENIAKQNTRDADALATFAQENKKYITQIERAYYGVITDAIEGCFAFNIDPDDYALNLAIQDGVEYTAALKQALETEKTIVKFYSDAAEQSKSLMADVPRAFIMVAKKRGSRIEKLNSLLNQ